MYCLKCGCETPEQTLFCPDCLQSMEAYPVRADTPVHLPKRPTQTAAKKTKQKEIPPEVQISRLRSKVRRLTLYVFLLFLALAVALAVLFFNVFHDGLPTLASVGYLVTQLK